MGHVLQRVIHAFAQTDEAAKIFEVKWDIKNGFWRMNCRKGEEFNFAYVLPKKPGAEVIIVVPTSLQMGWMESPPYFCAVLETGRDVAARYAEAPIGTLKDHKFRKLTEVMPEFQSLPATAPDERPNATKANGAVPERTE